MNEPTYLTRVAAYAKRHHPHIQTTASGQGGVIDPLRVGAANAEENYLRGVADTMGRDFRADVRAAAS
jgi:hypothetical protein